MDLVGAAVATGGYRPLSPPRCVGWEAARFREFANIIVNNAMAARREYPRCIKDEPHTFVTMCMACKLIQGCIAVGGFLPVKSYMKCDVNTAAIPPGTRNGWNLPAVWAEHGPMKEFCVRCLLDHDIEFH